MNFERAFILLNVIKLSAEHPDLQLLASAAKNELLHMQQKPEQPQPQGDEQESPRLGKAHGRRL